MKTNTKTDQILRPSDSLQTIEKKHGRGSKTCPYDFGSLIADRSRGIAYITYDLIGNPQRICFADGSVTEYVYTATGRKMRAIYYTAVPGITVHSGQTHQLTNAEILSKDSIDYLGSLIMENGVPSQYLFPGGYCSLRDGGNASVAFHYYNRDHLGNNREVVNESGALEQVTHYYPFGAPFCERTTAGTNTNATLQRYKYNGKELDLMHGLKWYDYGARMYDPILLTWNSIDPMCEKYYDVSPYAYCHNNPVKLLDPDGTDDYFDEKGGFIKRTDTGSNVLVMINGQYKNIKGINFSEKYSIIENIGRYYLAKSDKNDFKLTVSSTGGDIPIHAAFSNDTGTDNYDIYLTNGYVNNVLGNCYDFECVTFHESTHRYDSSTHGGTIGEANAIMLTANYCAAWSKASEEYIMSQASYAEKSVNMYARNNKVPGNIVKNLNKAFMGYASFELSNNYLIKNIQECIIFGINRQKR